AHILGVSEGGSMAILFAATYPQRTRSLILHGTMPRWSWAPDWPWGEKQAENEEFWRDRAKHDFEIDFAGQTWREWAGDELWDDAAFCEWWARFRRSGGTPAARKALDDMNLLLDVRPVLPAIQTPTLVTIRENDPVAPLDAVRTYSAQIPNATLKVFRGRGHLLGGVWDEWATAVEEFITGNTRVVPTNRFLATLAAADIVGSTQLIARIGDRAWRDTLDRHYELAASRLVAYGGVEVDRAGDGMLARFDGPARAISWARSVLGEDKTIGLETRAGIHTGEIELAGIAVRGMAVHIASRISALALPGEVLVSSTVRDLVAGSGFDFGDAEVVFTALPAGEAAKQAGTWLDEGRTVIDIGSDFRLRDPVLYERWYGYTHPAPALLAEAIYGLTELARDRIRGARLIANPGCYPTAA